MRLLFLPVLSFSLGLAAAAPASEPKLGCVRVDRCQDGSGIIDLGSLADTDEFVLRFEPLRSAEGHWDPCVPISRPEDPTARAAACVPTTIYQDNRFMDQYLIYGRPEGSRFSYDDSNKTLTVSYSNGEPRTVVHYRCSWDQSISSSRSVSAGAPLTVWVESPCACPSACELVDVGPGTILLIILCLSLTAYLIIGSCALRPFRTGHGVQMAPEDSVWCMSCSQLTERRGATRKNHCSLNDTL